MSQAQMMQQKKWQRQSVKFQNNLSVYVAGLPPQTSYWDLRNVLSQFGEVCATFVSTLKPRQTHKYGFGCFKSLTAVELATQSELKIHGVVVTVRQRTKSNWKSRDSELSRLESSSGPVSVNKDTSDRAASQPKYSLVNSDMAVHYARGGVAHIHHHVSSLPPLPPPPPPPPAPPPSSFMHPPEFTDFVHDTLASQYGTQGRLQAALRPLLPVPAGDEARNTAVDSSEDKASGRVARVDGVPASWEAEDLFNFLKEQGVPVTNVLVYDDFDERGLRQALAQLASGQITRSLCEVGRIEALNVRLDFATSCINSIGPVRRTYAGNFTAYGGDMQATEAYGYSVAEPKEPIADDSVRVNSLGEPLAFWPREQMQLSPVSEGGSYSVEGTGSVDSRSPSPEVDTPDTLVSPGSPIGKVPEDGFSDHSNTGTENIESYEEVVGAPPCATSFFMSRKQGRQEFSSECTGQSTQLQVSRTCTVKPHPLHGCAPFCGPSQLPMVFPKASQTVVVDNFDKKLIGDQNNLCGWVSRFGEVHTLDLVPLDERRVRAYITYTSPLDAQNTMHHLQLCMSGPFRLAVRLA